MNEQIDISVVIPVLNEEDNLGALSDEINQVMKGMPWTWECIWVDDGSTDQTAARLFSIARQDSRHRFLQHAKNFGQSAAFATGIRNSRGRIIVTLDGDGQNDPSGIPQLVQCLLDEDADMVNGWRQDRHDGWTRKISSRIGNGFRNWITNEHVRDVGCSLRAFRKECFDHVPVFKGMHRFFPTLVRMGGYEKILERPVTHRSRRSGKTKYGIRNRLWVGLADVLAVRWMIARMVFPVARKD